MTKWIGPFANWCQLIEEAPASQQFESIDLAAAAAVGATAVQVQSMWINGRIILDLYRLFGQIEDLFFFMDDREIGITAMPCIMRIKEMKESKLYMMSMSSLFYEPKI